MALGVSPGERVAVWATNVPEWVVLQFALAKIGAILVTVNTALRGQEIDYLLRQSGTATLVTIRGFRDVDYIQVLRDVGALGGGYAALEAHPLRRRRSPSGTIPYDELHAQARRISEDRARRPRARRDAGYRDQHAVHVGHDRVSQRRPPLQPEHRQQRLLARREGSASRRRIDCACASRSFTASAA